MSITPSADKPTNGRDASPAEPVAQVALHLRPVDHSDRAIVSNVSAVHAGSGMVFIDFGFVEQHLIAGITRAVRAGEAAATSVDGRLECRVAMSTADVAQLALQLQQVLASLRRQPAAERTAMEAGASSAGAEDRLQ